MVQRLDSRWHSGFLRASARILESARQVLTLHGVCLHDLPVVHGCTLPMPCAVSHMCRPQLTAIEGSHPATNGTRLPRMRASMCAAGSKVLGVEDTCHALSDRRAGVSCVITCTTHTSPPCVRACAVSSLGAHHALDTHLVGAIRALSTTAISARYLTVVGVILELLGCSEGAGA